MIVRALSLLFVTGCFASATRVQVAGMPPVPIEQRSAEEVRVLTRQASTDLDCPSVVVTRRSSILRATGCSKHGIYVEVLRGDYGEGDIATVTFVNVATSSIDDPALQGRTEDLMLVRTDEQASKDLSCPRSEIVPEVITVSSRNGVVQPVATGCGHRAVYLPITVSGDLRLASRVDAPAQ